MLANSSPKTEDCWSWESDSEANLLYATTAGMAAKRPSAVATRASDIPGATALIVACVASDSPWN